MNNLNDDIKFVASDELSRNSDLSTKFMSTLLPVTINEVKVSTLCVHKWYIHSLPKSHDVILDITCFLWRILLYIHLSFLWIQNNFIKLLVQIYLDIFNKCTCNIVSRLESCMTINLRASHQCFSHFFIIINDFGVCLTHD